MAITVKHTKVSTVPDSTDTSLVRPSDWNADHTLTGVGTAAALDAGVANGVATLDSGGKVPVSQIPQLGDLNYQGTWNASTNTPTLVSSTGTKGYYYVVSVAGTTNLNGITDWQIGDWAVFNGTAWQKIDNTDAVTSVNGYTGAVNLTYTDVGAFPATATTGTGNVVLQNGPTMSAPTIDGANPYIQFNNGSAVALAAGRLWYDGSTGSWNAGMGGGNITQQIGEELFVYGKASTAITDSPLKIVYQTGTVGASGTITFAPTVAGITSGDLILGCATESISLNAFGRITSFGVIHGITTNGTAYGETWANGDTIWYNPVTGNPTNVKPSAPNIKVSVGTIINAGSGSSGSIQVEVNHGSVLGGTDSNVQLTSVANANLLQYDSTAQYWKNVAPSAVTGVGSVANALTFNNSGTGDASGSTFNGSAAKTLSYNSIGAQPAGTYVTSVTGTAPVASSGGTTPVISIAAANTSTNGYLTSTDWNTFNSKGSGTVTSVGGTGTVNGLTLTGTVTSSGNLTLGGTLSLVSPPPIGTTTPAEVKATTGWAANLALSDASTVAWDTSTSQVATFTFVSTNRTMGAPTNLKNGAFYALAVIQNGGSNTMTWNSVFKWTAGAAPTLSTAAGAKDYFVFRSDGTNLYEQGRSLGVA